VNNVMVNGVRDNKPKRINADKGNYWKPLLENMMRIIAMFAVVAAVCHWPLTSCLSPSTRR